MTTYPPGEITLNQARRMMEGKEPFIAYRSWDGLINWHLMGPLAPIPGVHDGVVLGEDSIKGLIGTWQMLDQTGANQDGVTFNDAVYSPVEIDMQLEAHGVTEQSTRKVIRDWVSSWDAHRTGELMIFTPENGLWWGDVRWLKAPTDTLMSTYARRQPFLWTARIDDAFWYSFDSIGTFAFAYETMLDSFNVNYTDFQNLGPNWPQAYSGNGVGLLYADGRNAVWREDRDRTFFTSDRSVIAGPYVGHNTATDEQDVSIIFASTPQFALGSGAGNDIWCRMGRLPDGTWDGNGVRARIGFGYCRISVFRDYAEQKILGTSFTLLPPIAGNKYTLKAVAGQRRFRLILDGWGIDLLNVVDSSNISRIGVDYRGVGFGMQGGAAVIGQATPGRITQVLSGATSLDTFSVNIANGLGANWPLRYYGLNDAFIFVQGGEARWNDNSGTQTQEVVCGPYKDFNTATNNQVISMVWNSVPEVVFQGSAANDLWGRMSRAGDGTWNGNGIRARIKFGEVVLSRFNNYVETVLARRGLIIAPQPGDKFTLICGYEGDERLFKVTRNNVELMSHKERGTASLLGADYRGIGFGVRANEALTGQANPANIRKISAGDNSTVSQEGFLQLTNTGDVEAYPRYLVYGPGRFEIANGENSEDLVEIGPLVEGQVILIETEPRRRSLVDVSPSQLPAQVLNPFQQIIQALVSFASNNNVPPLLRQFENLFGIRPPQVNLYAMMKGRFTAAIEPKPTNSAGRTSNIKIRIDDGNATSKVVGALTPRRRWPL